MKRHSRVLPKAGQYVSNGCLCCVELALAWRNVIVSCAIRNPVEFIKCHVNKGALVPHNCDTFSQALSDVPFAATSFVNEGIDCFTLAHALTWCYVR